MRALRGRPGGITGAGAVYCCGHVHGSMLQVLYERADNLKSGGFATRRCRDRRVARVANQFCGMSASRIKYLRSPNRLAGNLPSES